MSQKKKGNEEVMPKAVEEKKEPAEVKQEPVVQPDAPLPGTPAVEAVPMPAPVPKETPEALMEQAERFLKAGAEARSKALGLVKHTDCHMRNPRGRIVSVPGRLVNELRRKGFLVVDPSTGQPLADQPRVLSEREEADLMAAVEGKQRLQVVGK